MKFMNAQNNMNNGMNRNFNKNNNFNYNNNFKKKTRPQNNSRNFLRNPEEVKQQLMPLYSRYMSHGRMALTQGDYVEAERNFQFAEHYMRTMNAAVGRVAAMAPNGMMPRRSYEQSIQESPSERERMVCPEPVAELKEGAEKMLDSELEAFPESVLNIATERREASVEETAVVQEESSGQESVCPSGEALSEEAPKRRRGRPPKNRPSEVPQAL